MQIINKSTELKLQTIDIEFNDIETIIRIVSNINRFSKCKTIIIIMNELNPSYWVGLVDKTIETIENLNLSWNYVFII